MKRYRLQLFESSEEVAIYSLKEVNSKWSETDRFIRRFSVEKDHAESFQIIIEFLKRILKYGSLERFFRPEGIAVAIPSEPCSLRLYGYRVSDKVLVLGNGGIKSARTAQESPDCSPHFELMRGFGKVLRAKRKQGTINVVGKDIIGDKNFSIRS